MKNVAAIQQSHQAFAPAYSKKTSIALKRGAPRKTASSIPLNRSRMKVAGVDILLLTQVVDVLTEGQRITHVAAFNKSGLTAFPARADSTTA